MVSLVFLLYACKSMYITLISKLQPFDSVKMTRDEPLLFGIVKWAQDSGQQCTVYIQSYRDKEEAEMKRFWFSLGTILMDRVGNDCVRGRVHVSTFCRISLQLN